MKAIGEIETNGNQDDQNEEKRIMHVPCLANVDTLNYGRKSQLAVIYSTFHLRITLAHLRRSVGPPFGNVVVRQVTSATHGAASRPDKHRSRMKHREPWDHRSTTR